MDLFVHLKECVPKRDKLKHLIASSGLSPPVFITAVAFVGATAIAVATCYLKPKQDEEKTRDCEFDMDHINKNYPPSEISQSSSHAHLEGVDEEPKVEANGEEEVKNEPTVDREMVFGLNTETIEEDQVKTEPAVDREMVFEENIETIEKEELNLEETKEEEATVGRNIPSIEEEAAEEKNILNEDLNYSFEYVKRPEEMMDA